MVAPSKLFEPPLAYLQCSVLFKHCERSCYATIPWIFYKMSKSAFQHYLPLLATPLALKYKKMDLKLFLDILKNYLDTVFSSSAATTLAFFLCCVFRKIFGRFYKYTTLFLPAYCGLHLGLLFPKRTMYLYAITSSQTALETLLRQYPNVLTNFVLYSKWMQSFLFMVSSAIIMEQMRLKRYKGFWFIQTAVVNSKTDFLQLECESNESPKAITANAGKTLAHTIWSSIKSYLLLGLSLDALQALIKGQVPKHITGFWAYYLAKLKYLRPRMAGFLVSYVGIYKILLHVFSKYCDHKSVGLQHMLAAFAGGASYIFVNKITFCTFALIIAIEVLWEQFCKKSTKDDKKSNVFIEILRKFPFASVMFPLNTAYFIHRYFTHGTKATGSLGKQICDVLSASELTKLHNLFTNNTVEHILENFK